MTHSSATRTFRGAWIAALILLVAGPGASPGQEAEAPEAKPPPVDLERDRGVLRQALQKRVQGNERAAEIQKEIDVIADETDALNARYRATLKQVEAIQSFNSQMRELIGSQTSELESVADQLDRVEEVGRNVTPLMLRMIDALETFVSLDVPFLHDERMERIADLRSLMERADLSGATKFRQIMEAYQIENEYGRTIEAYRGRIEVEGGETIVDLLRFGRISLVFQSLDGETSGVWNQRERRFELLPESFGPSIERGLRIARQLEPPDLIELPMLPPGDGSAAATGTEVAEAAPSDFAPGTP